MTREPKPVNINIRIPLSLYQAVDAYAEHQDVTLSEALRRLAVQALEAQGVKHTRTDETGTHDVPLDEA